MPPRLIAPPPEPAIFEAPQPAAYVATPVAYVPEPPPARVAEPSHVTERPAFETAALLSVVEEPHAVAKAAPPTPEFETPEPVAEVPPPVVEAMAAFWRPEPVAEVAPPIVEAVAAFETPEPVAEVPSPELEAPSSYAELPSVGSAPPPEPVFELIAPVFDETQETAAEVPPPPVEAIAHAELPFGFVEALMPTATLFEPPAESALEPEAEPDEEPAPAAEPSTPRRSWAARVPPATVLSMSRNPIRSTDFQPPPMQDPTMSGLDRLLRVSAARGASTLYLSTDAQPSVRVDGELQAIEGEPVLSARDVESLLLTLMPERSHEALRTGAATEWFCDIDIVGRVRCLSFRDHRGPGGVFRLMPTRSVSVDQLGLPRSVQALAIEPEGLVLVAGPRSSGKRTLLSAFVDQINKTRRDHVITIEREVNIVHEQSSSFVSQREVRGNDDEMLVAARAALREDPDVLVIEDLRTAALMNVALEAASAGRLVVAGFSAHTAAGAIDRIIDLYPPENRGQVQMALADCLRGVIVQVLLRNTSGGRVPAREVLLNTAAVSSVIAEGKTSQLSMAIEGGRRYGMMPINDGLVSLVQSGVVDSREAYRRSNDRPGFLAALKRHSIDTSFVERLA
jgi:twitching motility protein PilT